MKKSGIN